jgi:hypothetical protein
MAKCQFALVLFAFFLVSIGSPAQAADHLSSYLLHSPDAETLRVVGSLYGLEHRRGDDYEVIVPEADAQLLLLLAPRAELKEKDVGEAIRARLQAFALQSRTTATPFRYHSFPEVQAWLQNLEKSNPQLVHVVEYGKSQRGLPLLALHLHDGSADPKPILMITAATHGDELITTEVLMSLVEQLVEAQGRDQRLSAILAKHDLYFIPVLNPDGFTNQARMDNGRDPNRSYPYPGHEDARPTASIAAVMKFANSLKLAGSIDFHAYGELIMYPWAYTHDPVDSPHAARFRNMTEHMAETNRYTFGPISDVIYVAPGSSADYYFWKQGSASLGIEIGSEKVPDPSDFPNYIRSQAESTWRFIESF